MYTKMTLSKPNVFVTQNPQPASNDRLIMAADVVGGADAKPNGFGNLTKVYFLTLCHIFVALQKNYLPFKHFTFI